MAIERLGAERNLIQKTGTDKLFGNGSDGNVTIASNTSLSRDMYYENLTVNSGATLFTNGFKIFVKETLTNNGTIGMPAGIAQSTTIMAGSVMTRIDGSAGYISNDAVSGAMTLAEVTNMDSLIQGIMQKGASRRSWFAGAAGSTGNPGSANAGGGSGANPGTAGTGGSAGQGGGMVLVLSKSISGSGTFVSEGTTGTSGNPGVSGDSVASNPGHNPEGHAGAHNPGGAAVGHNPGGSGHNPGGHNPPGHFHHPSHHQAPSLKPNGVGHHPGHHNPCHQHSNPGSAHPGQAFSHPGNSFHYSHPGNPFHYSHPGNPFHNPSYAGGAANPGNPGASGNQGALAILTRNITTHVASSNLTYVEDIDD